jgi:PBP1b-binding outer membrane lipoprotein LpoB
MKRIVYVAVIAILFTACKGKNKITTTTTDENGNKTTTQVDVKSMQETANDMTKKIDELKKLTPLNMDQLKALVPEELNGIKRTNFSANSTMGFSTVEGEYPKDDTTNLKISVFDCAGEAGSGIYSLNYFTKMNYQQESNNGYTKTIDFMGGKAVEEVRKDQNECSLTYVGNDRLLITITGRNMTPDDLKKAAQQLNIKAS